MNFKKDIFSVEHRHLSDDNYLHIINVEKIDQKLKNLIDTNLSSIWNGDNSTDVKIAKIQLKSFLDSKKNSTIEKGAIAEFFLHLYLREIGFSQECLFQNLEEGSIKKGFDGYYSFKNEEWILESKSGAISVKGVSHINKIKEAYNDLNDKLLGKKLNNPWQNAFHHAKIVGSNSKIINNIKTLSDNYTNKKFNDIKDFNIIPGSTIFFEGEWKPVSAVKTEKDIMNLISKLDFNKIHVVCVNKKSVELFREYLDN